MKKVTILLLLILYFEKIIGMENTSQEMLIPFAEANNILKLTVLVENALIKPTAIERIPHEGLRRACKAAAAIYHSPGYNADQKLALFCLFIDSIQARLVLPHVTKLVEERNKVKKEVYSLLDEGQKIIYLTNELKKSILHLSNHIELLELKTTQLEKEKEELQLQLSEAQNSALIAQKNREKEYNDLNQALDRIQSQVKKTHTIFDQFPKHSQ